MTLAQYLRILWARKWLVLGVFTIVALAGIVITLFVVPRQYVAEASLVAEVRADPVLGAVAPGMASPAYIATQVEILRSDRVASRVVKMLGVERSPAAVQQWRDSTSAKIPLERYYADLLMRGLSVEPLRGSNVINIVFSSPDSAFAAAAANAFAQAYMDTSVELRVEPARQSAGFLDEQVKTLRTNLERAQERLSKFQQDNGIVVSDERMDTENARLTALTTQLTMAQAERVDAQTRQHNTGSETSPDVMNSPAVMALKGQLAVAETKLSEISQNYGRAHPQRQAVEAQVAELRRQLAAETRRVSGGSGVSSKGSAEKVAELQRLVDEQKQHILSLRGLRDRAQVLVRDVDTAQRAYDMVSQRVGQLNMEGQNTQAEVRLLSPAIEPFTPTKPRVPVAILGSLAGGLVLGALAALGAEMIRRRVRSPQDLLAISGVPVLGVLRPANSRQPVFRRLASGIPAGSPLLAAPGGQA